MKTVRCPQCNLVCWITVQLCARCGFEIQSLAAEISNADANEFEARERSFQTSPLSEPANPSDQGFQTAAEIPKHHFTEINSHTNNRSADKKYDHQRNYRDQGRRDSQSSSTDKKLAVTSLILGIAGLPFIAAIVAGVIGVLLSFVFGTAGIFIAFSLILILPLAALISGIVSFKRANKEPMQFGGKKIAIGGIVCSSISLVFLPIVGIIAAVAIPNLLAARRAANEGSAIASIRKIAGAETSLRQTTGRACEELKNLASMGLIDESLGLGERMGYRFVMTKLPTLKSDCAVTATPVSESIGNRAFYYSTEDGEIRFRKYAGQIADMNDEPIVSRQNGY